jgi:transcriptional regulator with XRE-family HTH domain
MNEFEPRFKCPALCEMRLKALLTQSELCARTGVSQSNVSKAEHNIRSLGLSDIKKIARALNCTVVDITNVTEDKLKTVYNTEYFTQWFNWWMAQRRLTVRKVAIAINVGITTIHRWQGGSYLPPTKRIVELAKLFETTFDPLVMVCSNPTPSPGECFRAWLKFRPISMRQLSLRTGITPTTLSEFKRGNTATPHPNTVAAIAKQFHITAAQLDRLPPEGTKVIRLCTAGSSNRYSRLDRLYELKNEKGLTFTQLSTAAGYDVTYVAGIACGDRYPSKPVLTCIAQVLGTTVEDLLC